LKVGHGLGLYREEGTRRATGSYLFEKTVETERAIATRAISDTRKPRDT